MFLKYVKQKYNVISVGKNAYDHLTKNVGTKLKCMRETMLRTDESGIFEVNKSSYMIRSQNEEAKVNHLLHWREVVVVEFDELLYELPTKRQKIVERWKNEKNFKFYFIISSNFICFFKFFKIKYKHVFYFILLNFYFY